MLKNILNNPWFVVALCAVATIYLGFVIGKPLLTDDVALQAPGADIPPFEFGSAKAATGTDSSSVAQIGKFGSHQLGDRAGITWLENVKRDPFASTIVQSEMQSEVKSAVMGANLGRTLRKTQPLPSLSAVFVGRGVSAAVLDDRLLNVGDTIRGYTVSQIERDQVTLARGRRTYFLEPGV